MRIAIGRWRPVDYSQVNQVHVSLLVCLIICCCLYVYIYICLSFCLSAYLCAVVLSVCPYNTVFVTTIITAIIVVDLFRFIAIVHPLNAKALATKSRTRRILIISWLLAFIVSVPYLFCKSYAFNISSQLGSITRRICTDRFDDIDIWLAALTSPVDDPRGQSSPSLGSFRKGFFLFLIVSMYVLPVLIIVYTCVHMSICLLRPADVSRRGQTARNFERNKRKVIVITIPIYASV